MRGQVFGDLRVRGGAMDQESAEIGTTQPDLQAGQPKSDRFLVQRWLLTPFSTGDYFARLQRGCWAPLPFRSKQGGGMVASGFVTSMQ